MFEKPKNDEFDAWQEPDDQHEWVSWVLFTATLVGSIAFAIVAVVALIALLTAVS